MPLFFCLISCGFCIVFLQNQCTVFLTLGNTMMSSQTSKQTVGHALSPRSEWSVSEIETPHQSLLAPHANKFHVGNGDDGKHYWLTPPDVYAVLHAEFGFDFDPCPFPLPDDFDGLTCEWGSSNYVNPPFGSIMHEGKKKGPTAWVRKAIAEYEKGKRVVLVYPIDKWVLMLVKAIFGEHSNVRNLGDVKWLATEDGSQGKGTGRHIACFILDPKAPLSTDANASPTDGFLRASPNPSPSSKGGA